MDILSCDVYIYRITNVQSIIPSTKQQEEEKEAKGSEREAQSVIARFFAITSRELPNLPSDVLPVEVV